MGGKGKKKGKRREKGEGMGGENKGEREKREGILRCKTRGNKLSIQFHKSTFAPYKVAENLFRSTTWGNPTKVKIICFYSPHHPHTRTQTPFFSLY